MLGLLGQQISTMTNPSSEGWQSAWEIVKRSNDCNFSDRRGVPLLSLCIIVSFNFEMFVMLSHDWTTMTRRMLSDLYLIDHALLRSFTGHLLWNTMRFVRRPNKMHCSAHYSHVKDTATRQKENTFDICPKFSLRWNTKDVKEPFVSPHCILHLHLWTSLELQYKSDVPKFDYNIVFYACLHWEERFLPRCHNLQS